jgi:pyruvate dehydrogenase E2 component (dihydrolipoamide acetyltransferase)
MATLLRMPEISANTVEAVLSEWPIAENTAFAAGDPIATVETDKAVVDVPADADGVLLRTLVEPGKSVSVGTPMAILGAPGEVIDNLDALVEQLTGAHPPVADQPSPAGTREVSQGAQPAAPPATASAQPAAAASAQPAAAASAQPAAAASAQPADLAQRAPSGAQPVADLTAPASDDATITRIFASPLARRIATENGLAVGDIRGTGPGGRIVRDDVHRTISQRSTTATEASAPVPQASARVPQAAASLPPSSVPKPQASEPRPAQTAIAGTPGYQDVPHSRMRRAIATRLTRSNQEAPVFSIRGSARVDALLAFRADLNTASSVKISVTDLLVAAAARAHQAVPEMNAIWLPDAVRRFAEVDIAVAVATDSGLVTPVVRGVNRLSVSALARQNADLVARARSGRLRQDELEGGTLTVTNLGVFGTEDFTAVINPPQAAILAVGAARQEAVVTDGQLGVATVLRVTLSVDHRPVDGAIAARWMAAFLGLLHSPLRILV